MKKELFIAMASIVIVVFAGAFLLLGGLETKGHERNAVVMVAGLISLFVAVTISIIAGRINPNIKEMAKLSAANVIVAVAIVCLISGIKIAIAFSLVFLFFAFVGAFLFIHERKSNDFIGISLIQILIIILVMTLTMII